ncbi:helix-turn-helix domain-containing protein [Paenibacillus sp. FSL P4-0338]|uniref:helix-turn-helix domain-containing protein n=1 Tax=Paenibacillus sp. FSL P4-0338 TaxID=2921635 RepID=UPI0030F92D1F
MTIFVRDLTPEEGNRLKRIARKGADPVQVRRALLILASAQKMKVPEISRLYHISGEHIRHTIHRFNREGMVSTTQTRPLRATYNRPHGVKHLLAALDLKTDQLYGHASKTKKHQDILRFFHVLRRRFHRSERL